MVQFVVQHFGIELKYYPSQKAVEQRLPESPLSKNFDKELFPHISNSLEKYQYSLFLYRRLRGLCLRLIYRIHQEINRS